MGKKTRLEPDAATARAISEVYGAAIALGALKYNNGENKSALPGFALAAALAEKVVADLRANMAGAVYRCAAKKGFNIAEVASIYTNIAEGGEPVIDVEEIDDETQTEQK